MSSEYFEQKILSYLINFVSAYENRPKLLQRFLEAIDEETIGGVQVEIIPGKVVRDEEPDGDNLENKFAVHIDGEAAKSKWNFAIYKDALITLKDRFIDEIEVPSNIKNLKAIALACKLDELDTRMLELVFVIQHLGIGRHLNYFEFQQTDALFHFTAGALQVDFDEISERLSTRSRLFKNGLLTRAPEKSGKRSFFGIEVYPRIVSILQGKPKPLEEIVECFAGTAEPRKLTRANYPYFENDIKIVEGILNDAIKSGKGADILLTGIHGTGKTQLVLIICDTLGLRPVQIGRLAIDEGRDLNRAEMLADFLSLQALAPSFDRLMALFIDECERLLSEEDIASEGTTNKAVLGSRINSKTTINFWVCNDIRKADKAYLRRMDHIIDFDIPPIAARRAIIIESCRRCGITLSERQLLNLSRLKIAPSLIDTAITGAAVSDGDRYSHISRIIQAFAPKLYGDSYKANGSIPENFQPDLRFFGFQNDTMPSWVIKLDKKLVDRNPITFSVAGPQGAGKTELARFIGEKLDTNTQEYDLPYFLPSLDSSSSEKIANVLDLANSNNNLIVIRAPLADTLKHETLLQELVQKSREEAIPLCVETQCNSEDFDHIPKFAVTFAARLLPLQSHKIDEAFEYFFSRKTDVTISDIVGSEGLVVGEIKLASERLRLLGIDKPSYQDLTEVLLSGRMPKKRIGFGRRNSLDGGP